MDFSTYFFNLSIGKWYRLLQGVSGVQKFNTYFLNGPLIQFNNHFQEKGHSLKALLAVVHKKTVNCIYSGQGCLIEQHSFKIDYFFFRIPFFQHFLIFNILLNNSSFKKLIFERTLIDQTDWTLFMLENICLIVCSKMHLVVSSKKPNLT